jgi:hypothetical protein
MESIPETKASSILEFLAGLRGDSIVISEEGRRRPGCTISGAQLNLGRRTLTEIVGLQLFLANVLPPLLRGEWMAKEQYEQLMRQVKTHKHRVTEQVLAEQPPAMHKRD